MIGATRSGASLQLNELENVKSYVQRITTNYFAQGVPALESVDVTAPAEEEEMSSAWSTSPAVFSRCICVNVTHVIVFVELHPLECTEAVE